MSKSKSMKREAPDPVDPVVIGAIRYDAPHYATEVGGQQNGGWVTATDIASGERLWTVRVYETAYDPKRERDVQETFITGLADAGGGRLEIEDEDGRRFVLETATRQVRPA